MRYDVVFSQNGVLGQSAREGGRGVKREGWETGHGELNACDKMTHLRLIGYGHALFAGSYLE